VRGTRGPLSTPQCCMGCREGLRSLEEVAQAMQAQLALLAGAPEFLPWVRTNPFFKPRLSGSLATAQGVRRATILLDTGATHCFIARLVAVLGLPPSGQPGPLWLRRWWAALVHLFLGDAFRESMSISPMDIDVFSRRAAWGCGPGRHSYSLAFSQPQQGLHRSPCRACPR
jgi:hypothetical protein